jgi:Protein of unknown function (DUF4231)
MSTDLTQTNDKTNWKASIESRGERADYYFQTILKNQREWYSKKAGRQKNWHLFFAITVILLGIVISFLQVYDGAEAYIVRYATAALGAAVTMLRAADTLLHPGETWQGYRKASENMKREYRLYINNADTYTNAPNEDAAYRLFVERVETVLAEEQQLFWQSHAKNPEPQAKAKPQTENEEK